MNSTFQIDHNRLFNELKGVLKKDIAKITGEANGGRSILMVYPPIDDDAYITAAKHELKEDRFEYIDLRQLFTAFIEEIGWDDFKENYRDFGHEVFFSENFEEGTFFSTVMEAVASAFQSGKIPVLVHTGTIYGMGFSNINIMEHPIVMQSPIPLVVFYPATVDKDNIKFLGKQIASKYRCIVIK